VVFNGVGEDRERQITGHIERRKHGFDAVPGKLPDGGIVREIGPVIPVGKAVVERGVKSYYGDENNGTERCCQGYFFYTAHYYCLQIEVSKPDAVTLKLLTMLMLS
jgi:hypothetical protein